MTETKRRNKELRKLLINFKEGKINTNNVEKEILSLFNDNKKEKRLTSYMQDVIGKKYNVYFEDQDIYELIEVANQS